VTVFAELSAFLEKDFPGSDLDEGYYFVRIKAPHETAAIRGRMQPIADDLCAGRAWLVVVGADPAPFTKAAIETREVRYRSDWNVDEPKTMYGAELAGPVDITALGNAIRGPGTEVIIAPDRGLALDVSLARVHAKQKTELDRLVAAHPDSFSSRP